MMNKSAIDWCDFSWNPVTGCNFGCEYCYARRQATRFSGNTRLNMTNEQLKTETAGLYVLEQPFKNYNGAQLQVPSGFNRVAFGLEVGAYLVRQGDNMRFDAPGGGGWVIVPNMNGVTVNLFGNVLTSRDMDVETPYYVLGSGL